MLSSAIYQGTVHHHRAAPRTNSFTYPLSMFLIDLDKPSILFDRAKLASYKKFNLAEFNPKDYLGRSEDLKQNVVRLIHEKSGYEFSGQILLLSQIRRLGYVFNPVSFYFCFSEIGELQFIVSEIENTPWGERFSYVHEVSNSEKQDNVFEFSKEFHVSPFLPMNMVYKWKFAVSDQGITIGMRCRDHERLILTTSLKLKKKEATAFNIDKLAVSDLFVTFKILFLIYFQAIKLWIKRVPFYQHPDNNKRWGE